MDVTEHPAVIATTDLIGRYDQLVAAGELPMQLAYALLAADILGCSVDAHRRGGPPEVVAHLVELASSFAIARRHDALVAALGVPDTVEGIDQDGEP